MDYVWTDPEKYICGDSIQKGKCKMTEVMELDECTGLLTEVLEDLNRIRDEVTANALGYEDDEEAIADEQEITLIEEIDEYDSEGNLVKETIRTYYK